MVTLKLEEGHPIPKLASKSTIALVTPARYMPEEKVTAIVQHLKVLGYETKVSSHTFKSIGSLAGTDQERADDLMKAWEDPQVGAVWCLRGGFGAARILPYLDFELIRKNPKPFIGMSDITVLHAAINQQTGLPTFLGPVLLSFFDGPNCQECAFTRDSLWQTLSGNYALALDANESEVIAPGEAWGVLTGGTLTLIAALMGTPWQLQTAGKIVLLEDVEEEPYRIDRMLCQLQQGGLFDKVAGIILATWKDCKARDPALSFTLDEIFHHYFGQASFPVIKGFPSGHAKKQVTLPLGVPYHLTAKI